MCVWEKPRDRQTETEGACENKEIVLKVILKSRKYIYILSRGLPLRQ